MVDTPVVSTEATSVDNTVPPVPVTRTAGGTGNRRPFRTGLLVALAAVGLTLLFWFPLWTGGGLVGGDIYAYFLPQKAYFAELLSRWELPWWNPRIGWGYPQLAESQTGVYYPLHWPLYRWLDLNAALNASILLHYVLAFVGSWVYSRKLGLAPLAAGFSALVFVYGWFPPRVCLEWAILGGAWLPWALWSVEQFLDTRCWRYALGLTGILALQMLAGHFTLAFITQVTIALYVPARLWLIPGNGSPEVRPRVRSGMGITLAIVAAFLLAAAQLIPTWELKEASQRQTVNAEHDPGYGYIPPRYLWQSVVPWYWYPEEHPFHETLVPGAPRTNRVEAHLYFGLLSIPLIGCGVWSMRKVIDRRLAIWLGLGGVALVATTGLLVPITRHLPGFSFFEGPGRFGVVTTLAAGLWAGVGFAAVLRWLKPSPRRVFIVVAWSATVYDLWQVSRQVTYAIPVDDPPIRKLADSPIGRRLAEFPEPVRLFSEGKNLPSLLGVATLPTYLGLGPEAYFDPDRMVPGEVRLWSAPQPGQVEWMRNGGVTHLLSFLPMNSVTWPVRSVWSGRDPFLNAALARRPDEPMFLYALTESRGRVAWEDRTVEPAPQLEEYSPHRVVVKTAADRPARLILTDLAYPGWRVTVDGRSAEGTVVEGTFRGVLLEPGPHTVVWSYRSRSIWVGGGISVMTGLLLAGIAHIRFWHPAWLNRVLARFMK
ncbi:MAG: hypothetical protein ACKV0T_00755 [Planctomycetales bacterium]